MSPPLDPDSFRSVLGRFTSGVTVVTATDAAGTPHGMTVSAFCSLSLQPPLVLVCIARDSSILPVLREASYFAVNILTANQEAISRRFAGLDDANRFHGIGYTQGKFGTALIDDVLAWLECRLVGKHDGGDHEIFIGEVESAHARAERPLLYYRGGYATLER